MNDSQNSDLKVVFGSMTFGLPGTLAVRVHQVKDAAAIIDVFQKHGHTEVDSARGYGNGTTEEFLGDLHWEERGLIMGTKLYPNFGFASTAVDQYTHQAADVRRGLMRSLKALKASKIDLFYLHGPDRKTPYEVTLGEVDKLHKEGYFARFGISNYMSWEVAQICEICDKHGWIKPTVYQGIYNALHRTIEPELFPCLRRYGISLYAFQPLAGGFLTSRYQRDQADFDAGSRFDPSKGVLHRGRYWNDTYFDALDIIRTAAKKHGLTEAESALRWLKHHSHLRKEQGDAIIVGATSTTQLEQNLADLEKGQLPEEVVHALDQAWLLVKGVAPNYWH
ncbi:hypothetical protein CJF32_00002911 [Rutstroemia sp. NJR-2017a WRK4]|nr:hypothetical protein CJF32_00002911 [Rutstroemia sp. NJR-2017a WRK4]